MEKYVGWFFRLVFLMHIYIYILYIYIYIYSMKNRDITIQINGPTNYYIDVS